MELPEYTEKTVHMKRELREHIYIYISEISIESALASLAQLYILVWPSRPFTFYRYKR